MVATDNRTVGFLPDSSIGEWTFGEFNGTASRKEARSKRWCPHSQTMLRAEKEHYRVTVVGINGAWRDVAIPLKRGRTLAHAVILACSQFNSPSDIIPDQHGWFGRTIDLR